MISRRIVWSLTLCAALGGASLIVSPAEPSIAQTQPDAFVSLQVGSSGPRVTELQVLLRDLSYYQGEVSGRFDDATATALLAFQTNQQLPQTAILDGATWERLQFTQTNGLSDLPATPGQGSSGSATAPTPKATPKSATSKSATPKSSPSAAPKAANVKASDARLRWLLLGVAGLGVGVGSYGLVRASRKPSRKAVKQPSRTRSLVSATNPLVNPAAATATIASSPIATSPTEIVSPLRDAGAVTLQAPLQSDEIGPQNTIAQTTDYGVTRSATRLPRIDIVEALMVDIQSNDAEKRRKAIWELGQRGDSRAVQPLVNLMAISDSRQRSLILASLSEIGIQTLKPMKRALAMSLQDENADVRKNAIRDLTRIYDLVGQISQLLNFATEDNDGEVRETAHWALGQLNRIRSATPDSTTALLQQAISPPELFNEEVKLPDRTPQQSAEAEHA